jgi:hypothetical protein
MLEIKDSHTLPGLDILRSFNKQLDCLLKTEIDGHLPGLKDILNDYSAQLNYLLEADDRESALRLEGILKHHSLKLEKLEKHRFEIYLDAFHLDPIECQKNGATQSEIGSKLEYYEDGTCIAESLKYLSVCMDKFSIQETFSIYEKYQLEAIGKIKETLIQRAIDKYNQIFETREERVALEQSGMGYAMAEHHARMEDLHEHLYDRTDGSVV